MTPERARAIEDICSAALDRAPEERAAFLHAVCAGDEAMHLEVASLLARADDAEGFLDGAAVHLAARDLAGSGRRLLVGRHLGAYEILSLLGAGGMGEVYRARDTVLQRDVAVKVLPSVFSDDPDRLARFEREAQVLASLNHRHIAAIYGHIETDGVRALVLELVEGDTLAERLAVAPLPVADALEFARQLADALDAAHERGLIHRDLKPANLKLTADGILKVLDFGLAKPVVAAASSGTPPGQVDTHQQTILGTPGYMSPEQARGKALDKRTDIWAFGCVLYEMLTGQAAMRGETAADITASVLNSAPDWEALPRDTPAGVRRLLTRCFEKDPKRRLHDIADARLELDDVAPVPDVKGSQPAMPYRWLPLGGMAAAVAVAGAVMLRLAPPVSTPQPELRFSISPPDGHSFSRTASDVLAVSPDGTTVTFVVATAGQRDELWLRPFDTLAARRLPGTAGAQSPFWAPDSQSIGFFADGLLKTVSRAGGDPRTICEAVGPRQAAWNRDDVILFAADSRGAGGLRRVSATGGAPTTVTTPDRTRGESGHLLPAFLPDGRHFAFAVTAQDGGGLYIGGLDSPARVRLAIPVAIRGATSVAYAPPGFLLFVVDGTLWAQPFDADRFGLSGEPVRVADGILDKSVADGAAAFSVSATGVLAYWGLGAETPSAVTWISRDGHQTPVAAPPGQYGRVSLAPDGRRAAMERRLPTAGSALVLLDLASGSTTRLTADAFSIYPIWSPDGSAIVFSSTRGGPMAPYRQTISAGEEARQILALPQSTTPTDWSPDGQTILYQTGNYPRGDIGTFSLAGGADPHPLLHSAAGRADGHLSRDGRWLAYVSLESDVTQIFVTSFPDEHGKWRISNTGGREPRWRQDGTELYFLSPDQKLMSAAITTTPAFHAAVPAPVFDARVANYAPAADGRFLVVGLPVLAPSPPLTVVVNWAPAPGKKKPPPR